jgi:hypothetical protein
MPAEAVTSFINALDACASLRAGDRAADDSLAKLVARLLHDTGEQDAEALQRAVSDELAAPDAALAALAEHQGHLCVAAAAIPEARAHFMEAWSSFTQSPELATVEAELTRRLILEGRSDDDARAAVSTALATANLEASLAGTVRSGYDLVQTLADAALRRRHHALLAALHHRLRADRGPSVSPRPALTDAPHREMTRAIEALQERMENDPDDPSLEAELEELMADLEEVALSGGRPTDPGIARVDAARGQLAAAVESLQGSLLSGDRAARAAAATQLATTAEALLLAEVAPLVAAVDEGARRDRRASPADAVAVGGLVRDLLDASASGRRLAWDAGWSADIDALAERIDAASYLAPRPHAHTVIGELLAVQVLLEDPVGAALVVETTEGEVNVLAPGLDPDAVGLRRGSAVAAEGAWDTTTSPERALVVARRADSGALAMTWSVEDAAAASLRRQRWRPLEVE